MFEAIQKALAIGTLAEDEYMQGDIVMCSKCLTPRSSIIRGMNLRHACKCRRAEYDRVRQESKDREKQAKIKQLRIDSLMGERYKDFRFSTVETGHNPNFDAALARCRSYAEKHEVVLKKGWGIYLHGPKGTGKTTLTACMANDLLSKVKQVSFTNFFEISKAIRATYGGAGNEGDLIERIGTIDFLFLDDLGTERLKKDGEDTWMQERIFEIVNKRYNHRKPTVFTSNYGLNQLVSRGMMDKTVDRISEMSTAIIKIDGESYRGEITAGTPAVLGEGKAMSVQKAEIIRVIHTISSKGKGTADDMGRLVDQYWSFNGKLLAERDPCKELFGGKGDKEIEQFISGD